MLETLIWLIGAPTWLVGGAYSAKHALAVAEKHYLKLSYEAWQKDSRNTPQDKMDADDWIGASIFAAGAFAGFPVIAAGWGVKKAISPFYGPTRKFFLPPLQKGFEQHVEQMDTQKDLILSNARLYDDVKQHWQPDDEVKTQKLKELQETITDQMNELRRMADTTRASGFDTNYLEAAHFEVKELTVGSGQW